MITDMTRLRKFYNIVAGAFTSKREGAKIHISGPGVASVNSSELIQTEAAKRQIEAFRNSSLLKNQETK